MSQARGLKNLGNTCFLNAVIQAISSCPPIVKYLESFSDKYSQFQSFGKCLHKCLLAIRGNRWGSTNIEHLLKMVSIDNPDFGGQDQQDAQELFQVICKMLNEEKWYKPSLKAHIFNRQFPSAKDASTDNFNMINTSVYNRQLRELPLEGLKYSQIWCHSCRINRQTVESFNDISLHISNPQQQLQRIGLTLENCIATALQSDEIDEVECPSCTAQCTIETLNNSILDESKSNLLLLANRTFALGEKDSLSCFFDIDNDDAIRLSDVDTEDLETKKDNSLAENSDYINMGTNSDTEYLGAVKAMDIVKLNQGRNLKTNDWLASADEKVQLKCRDSTRTSHGISGRLRRYGTEAVCPAVSPLVNRVRTKITKSYALARLPQVLCFHINRNTYDVNGRLKKLDQLVLFEEKLDMAKFLKPAGVRSIYHINSSSAVCADPTVRKVESDTVFDLCSVIEHRGSANQGHYVTYSRVSDSSSGEFNWMYFSDEQVSKVNWKHVKMCQAYMLLYVRRSK